MIEDVVEALKEIGHSFKLEPFASIAQPIIEEVLADHEKDKYRQGTILTPCITVWLVLGLTLRRDLNYHKTLNWLISGFRWISLYLPLKIVKDGAISHARSRLRVGIFRDIYYKLVSKLNISKPDFYRWKTVMFDGTTMTMPDTKSNQERFGKHRSGRGSSAFPQMRTVALMVMSIRHIIDIAYAPCKGKKTGERSLMFEILSRCKLQNLLFLFDAGFYSFYLAWYMKEKGFDFIMKVSKSVILKAIPNSKLLDGSYLSIIKGKIENPEWGTDGQKKWMQVEMIVRVIVFQIPGFRPVRLITSIMDESITAKEIIIHYHRRWDIEITYDEIKTHQCATLKGQIPTNLRSKRADFVEQELYAILITYNLIRSIIVKSTDKEEIDPLSISFLEAMHIIIEATPFITSCSEALIRSESIDYMFKMVASASIDRPRRHRYAPRVVKVKMSNFKRKRNKDISIHKNFEDDIQIICEEAA